MKKALWIILSVLILACSPSEVPESEDAVTNTIEPAEYAIGFAFETKNNNSSLLLYDLVGHERKCFLRVTRDTVETFSSEFPVVTLNPDGQFATLSTTHLSYFAGIDELQKVAGTAYASWVKSEKPRAAIDKGEIIDISGEKDVDFEKVVNLNVQALLTYPYGNTDYSLLEKTGVHIIPCSEYLEEHPLGRAEWIKVIGFLTGKEELATERFNAIRDEYNKLVGMAADISPQTTPEIFTGSHSNGKWYAPTKTSFIAQLIDDAGGNYLFANDALNENTAAGENLEMDFEVFMSKAAKADFWGKVVYEEEGLNYASIQEEDPRYAGLKAFQEGGVFYCNASVSDYFGDAMLEPHFILNDLIHILHPTIFDEQSDYVPHYFKMLDRE